MLFFTTIMALGCSHVVYRISDLNAAREFYAKKLGLPVLMDSPHMLAVKAGDVRLSFHGGHDRVDHDLGDTVGASVVLRTDDLESTVAELRTRGVEFVQDVAEAPGFMRFTAAKDPDGNVVFVAQYLTEQVV